MGGLQKATLRYLLICMLVAWCGVVQASDFLRVCQSSMPKAESFLADCRQNARPFKRYFYPGGRGAPVPEEHAAWFDLPDGDSHFAMGCVLGPKGRIDFVGLYFAFKPPNFRIANSTPFTFIDFQGNVGLRPSQGAPFTLLAVRQLRVAGQDRIFTYPDCETGQYDATINQTVYKSGIGFHIMKLEDGNPTIITFCIDREIRYLKTECSDNRYRSFLNALRAPIIYHEASIVITEESGLYIEEGILKKMCETSFRSAREYVNIIVELCDARR